MKCKYKDKDKERDKHKKKEVKILPVCWIKKLNLIKIKLLSQNHRANDGAKD